MSYLSFAEAPSNIALIKYMGKTSHIENKPSNASVSLTLDHLRSKVAIVNSIGRADTWAPLGEENWTAPSLSDSGQERFLKHFEFLKSSWGVEGQHQVLSANNFPADCGIASSASSFAALTLATWYLAKSLNPNLDLSQEELSSFSRKGSGSSCRSLFSPWAIWREDFAESFQGLPEELEHQVVIVSDAKKEVSSSSAHKRVATSPLFEGRVKRAESRLEKLLGSLKEGDWKTSAQICRDEFEDMHQLFETSVPAFSYRNEGSKQVVEQAMSFWALEGDGPIPTMDAGANVHLIWRKDQKSLAEKLMLSLPSEFKVINSPGLWGY